MNDLQASKLPQVNLAQSLAELVELKAHLKELQVEFNKQLVKQQAVNESQRVELENLRNAQLSLSRQRRLDWGLSLGIAFLFLWVAVGAIGDGQGQVQAQFATPNLNSSTNQTGPKSQAGVALISGPSVNLLKFCPYCNRSNISYPAGLDLNGAYLVGAYYSFSNLSSIYLQNADLRGANLSYATLGKATLYRANLRNADLRNADLIDANLIEADLYNANLAAANLTNAVPNYANLSHANLSGTGLGAANLGGAHGTPSTIAGATWNNTICPDWTNSDSNGGTCASHWLP